MRTADWTFLLDLAAEVGELPRERSTRWRHYTDRLAGTLRASCGMMSHVYPGHTLAEPIFFGFTDRHRLMLDTYVKGGYEYDPCGYALGDRTQPFEVAHRDELITPAAWYRSEHYNLTRRPYGIDEALYGKMTDARQVQVGLCFIRERGAPKFSRREKRLLELANQHVHPLLMLDDPPGSPLSTLAPRLRAVAERLLAGDSSKQAARRLGLSVHTVVQYTKLLHRQLGVSSRSELLLVLMGRKAG